MSKIIWDEAGKREYETGVDRGVLYPIENGTYKPGVPWNGLRSVTDSPSGAEPTPLYANNKKYLTLMSAEELGITIGAYVSPKEFDACDGSEEIAAGVMIGQQNRQHFGFTYRTLKGNDTESNDHGYKIHIVYDGVASPSEKNYESVNDSPEAADLSWEVSTNPIAVDETKSTCSITIDSTRIPEKALKAIEDILYGTADKEATLPMPAQIVQIVTENGTETPAA